MLAGFWLEMAMKLEIGGKIDCGFELGFEGLLGALEGVKLGVFIGLGALGIRPAAGEI